MTWFPRRRTPVVRVCESTSSPDQGYWSESGSRFMPYFAPEADHLDFPTSGP